MNLSGHTLTAELVAELVGTYQGPPLYVYAHPRNEDAVRAGIELTGRPIEVRINRLYPPDRIEIRSEPYA